MHTHGIMASTQEHLSLSSSPNSISKAFCEDKDFSRLHDEHAPAGNHPSPELIEDVREKGLLQADLIENMSSPVTAAVLTSISEDSRDQFENSVLQLREQDESETAIPQGNRNAMDGETNSGADDVKVQFNRSGSGSGGFLEGLFGCLRPVWNIIGKAYSTDYKLQQQGKWGSKPSLLLGECVKMRKATQGFFLAFHMTVFVSCSPVMSLQREILHCTANSYHL